MAAADGLLVRLKPSCGILPAATAHALADLAERHGNGRLDLTARASLQIRGVDETTLPGLVAALRELGLVDADAASEAVRNVLASPLAGLHAGPDIRPVVAALEARLAASPALHALPAKFRFLVDDGSAPSLAGIAADVRFDWTGDMFAIGLGGPRAQAVAIGACEANALVDHAEAIARGAVVLFARIPGARRMRDLLAALGIDTIAEACGAPLPQSREKAPAKPADEGACPDKARDSTGDDPSSALRAPSPARGEGSSRPAFLQPPLALAPPYGRLDAGMLRLAAELAAGGELRLTPWRSLLVPGAGAPELDDRRARARHAGFIVEADDPRHAVAACVGAPECARATTATRSDADALVALAAALPSHGVGPRLHVSGCAKGCALAAPARVTLVGRDGRYDLVVDGCAGDTPVRHGLDLAGVRGALAMAATERNEAARPLLPPAGEGGTAKP